MTVECSRPTTGGHSQPVSDPDHLVVLGPFDRESNTAATSPLGGRRFAEIKSTPRYHGKRRGRADLLRWVAKA
jgi:hypothetical protein